MVHYFNWEIIFGILNVISKLLCTEYYEIVHNVCLKRNV